MAVDEGLIGIVADTCADAVADDLSVPLTERIAAAFWEARKSCQSFPIDAQFRGALKAVCEKGTAQERRDIEAELRNIELISKAAREGTEDSVSIPVLVRPLGLTMLWRQARGAVINGHAQA